jgi:hypothetical protein
METVEPSAFEAAVGSVENLTASSVIEGVAAEAATVATAP